MGALTAHSHIRHARACPGHARLCSPRRTVDGDGRDMPDHDAAAGSVLSKTLTLYLPA